MSKQVSSRLTKTRVRTFFLAWELCLIIVIYYYYFLSHSRSREGVSGEVARKEDGSPCQEEKGLSRPKLCSNFFSFFKNMICIMSLFRSTRVDLGKEGRPLRVYFLLNYFIVLKRNWVTSLYLFLLINYTIVKETPLASQSSGIPSSFRLFNKIYPQKIVCMTFMFVFLNNLSFQCPVQKTWNVRNTLKT